jgi:predicted metal-binding membrane protein
MMAGRWDLPHVLLLFAMWTVMMVGMMLPSAAPTLLLYGAVARRGPEAATARQRIYVLTAGYLGIWVLFSAAATLVQRALGTLLILSPMMRLENRAVSGAVLLLAGVYQLTPLKQQCLISCRSPLSFIMQHWRPGTRGAFRLGIMHGWYCLGCCWALMLLLFAGGVMNLAVIAALMILVLLEKVMPFGVYVGRITGVALIGLAVWMFASS